MGTVYEVFWWEGGSGGGGAPGGGEEERGLGDGGRVFGALDYGEALVESDLWVEAEL